MDNSLKTVCVFAKLKVRDKESEVVEHSTFGSGCKYETASDFIAVCQLMWKKHSDSYVITNIVIG